MLSHIQPIVLAAGKGTRMNSDLPKVLVEIGGQPMLNYLLNSLAKTEFSPPIVVVGYEKAKVMAILPPECLPVDQGEPKGTGHALQVGMTKVPPESDTVLLLYGDMPFWQSATMERLAAHHAAEEATITLAIVDDNSDATAQFGRIVRGVSGQVEKIVEIKHASPAELALTERNAALYIIDKQFAEAELPNLQPHEATPGGGQGSGEYYATDLIEAAITQGRKVITETVPVFEATGINTPEQLAAAKRVLQEQTLSV